MQYIPYQYTELEIEIKIALTKPHIALQYWDDQALLIFLFPYINNYEQSGNESRTHSNIPSQSVQYLIGYLVFVNYFHGIFFLCYIMRDLPHISRHAYRFAVMSDFK
jgi:hypothetical protein